MTKIGVIKTLNEIALIAEGGKLLSDILEQTSRKVMPGISTWELNEFAETLIAKVGGSPSFKGYGSKQNPFPSGLCTSINDVVVHGMPNKHIILANGDIIGLDIGMRYKGFFTDMAITVGVGQISETAKKLIATTKLSLEAGILNAKQGNTIGDIGYAIQTLAEKNNFSVVRDLVGHGVGYDVHEDPAVPCYGKPHEGEKLQIGMVLAIEPMLCEKKYNLVTDGDGWTIRTKDHGLSAHFEHTIAITNSGTRTLTQK